MKNIFILILLVLGANAMANYDFVVTGRSDISSNCDTNIRFAVKNVAYKCSLKDGHLQSHEVRFCHRSPKQTLAVVRGYCLDL